MLSKPFNTIRFCLGAINKQLGFHLEIKTNSLIDDLHYYWMKCSFAKKD